MISYIINGNIGTGTRSYVSNPNAYCILPLPSLEAALTLKNHRDTIFSSIISDY